MPRRNPSAVAHLLLAVAMFVTTSLHARQGAAPTPPMGWSEWDAYGLTVTEGEFKANAAVLAGLNQYGWQYALIDAGWYMERPSEFTKDNRGYILDRYGRLIPAANRFPSAADGAGFKPLAEWLHARGLKLGIHVMPGIPRQAVTGNLPIAGSSFHAADAADTTQTCSWDSEFYVARDNAAGQAYYDSILRMYADWGVDYIKLGCVSDHPFHPGAIRQIAEAIKKVERPIVLSLSPGPPPQQYVDLVTSNAQMWRFAPEHWDFWAAPAGKDAGYPIGLREAFDLFAKWEPYVKPGNWVDGDALPVGWLGPHPGWGEPRESRESEDEQRTEFTLWAVARSPMILGANLTKLNGFTRALVTNKELIQINQGAQKSHPLEDLPPGFENARVWETHTSAANHSRVYLAFFNLEDKRVTLHARWSQLGMQGTRAARNVWDGRLLAPSENIDVTLPAHGSTIYQVR